jgi:hypothetical protein
MRKQAMSIARQFALVLAALLIGTVSVQGYGSVSFSVTYSYV